MTDRASGASPRAPPWTGSSPRSTPKPAIFTRPAYRDDYKAHVAAEPDIGLVTACDLGVGNAGDTEAAPGIVENESAGTEVLGHSAYSAGEFRAHFEAHDLTAVIKPQSLRPAVEGGSTLDDFTIDPDAGTLTSPEDITVTISPGGTPCLASRAVATPEGAHVVVVKRPLLPWWRKRLRRIATGTQLPEASDSGNWIDRCPSTRGSTIRSLRRAIDTAWDARRGALSPAGGPPRRCHGWFRKASSMSWFERSRSSSKTPA